MKFSRKMAHLALKKVVSSIIITGIAVSLTACPADTAESVNQIDDRTTVAARPTESEMGESGMSEPNQTIDPVRNTTVETTEAMETTAETTIVPQGTYTYVLYEGTPQQTTITMDYDIQPGSQYLQQHNYPTAYYFEIDSLASSLGWKLNGAYSIEETDEDTGPTYFYTYDYGDYLVILEVEANPDITYSEAWTQIEALRIAYVKKGDFDTPYFEDNDPNHYDIVIEFANHAGSIEYPGLGSSWAFSRNDCVLMTYLFWLIPKLGEANTNAIYNTLLPAAVTTTDEETTRVLNLQ
ncbi:hypothetical protein IK110_02145 [Candidatus Saccharibacteria bacterium]|nr:hypothetical protein [Candidatus Saccharibacteria bacterium]